MEDNKWKYNTLKIPPLIPNSSLLRSFASNYSFALFISIKKKAICSSFVVFPLLTPQTYRFSVSLKSISFVGPWTGKIWGRRQVFMGLEWKDREEVSESWIKEAHLRKEYCVFLEGNFLLTTLFTTSKEDPRSLEEDEEAYTIIPF